MNRSAPSRVGTETRRSCDDICSVGESGCGRRGGIRIGARVVWLQEGVLDAQVLQRTKDAGLLVVMDRRWLKERQ